MFWRKRLINYQIFKGECLRLLGSHKEAIICFDKALSLDSSLLNSYKGRGN